VELISIFGDHNHTAFLVLNQHRDPIYVSTKRIQELSLEQKNDKHTVFCDPFSCDKSLSFSNLFFPDEKKLIDEVNEPHFPKGMTALFK
jgi:hypothetical protein